jgi:hypothetical protein
LREINPPARVRKQSECKRTVLADERIADAGCTCNFFQQNRLRKGPCAHVLALRLLHARQRRVATTLAGTA